MDLKKIAGWILFAGVLSFLILLSLAIASYADYSFSENYLSDLGVDSKSGGFFLAATVLLGTILMLVSWLLMRQNVLPNGILALAGLSLIGVGFFPKTVEPLHTMSAAIVFISGGLAAFWFGLHWFSKNKFLATSCFLVGTVPLAFVAAFQNNPLAQKIAVAVMVLGCMGLCVMLLSRKK